MNHFILESNLSEQVLYFKSKYFLLFYPNLLLLYSLENVKDNLQDISSNATN